MKPPSPLRLVRRVPSFRPEHGASPLLNEPGGGALPWDLAQPPLMKRSVPEHVQNVLPLH